MELREVADDVAVAGQITPQDVTELAAQGYKALICNRPDGEAADQPPSAEIRAAAELAGMEFRYIPIVPGIAGQDEVRAMADALNTIPRPVLAFCRSGARSETFYNAAVASQG